MYHAVDVRCRQDDIQEQGDKMTKQQRLEKVKSINTQASSIATKLAKPVEFGFLFLWVDILVDSRLFRRCVGSICASNPQEILDSISKQIPEVVSSYWNVD